MDDVELEQREAWMLAEERLSVVRHDLRNRLGTLHNASFYLKRKAEKSELWAADAKISYFFSLIDDELKKSEALLADALSMAAVPPRPAEAVSLRKCVERAVASLRRSAQIQLEPESSSAALSQVNELEVALLARCLLQSALEVAPELQVQVRMGQGAEAVVLEVLVGAPDSEFGEVDAGLASPALRIARRVCQRYRAELRCRQSPAKAFVATAVFFRNDVAGTR